MKYIIIPIITVGLLSSYAGSASANAHVGGHGYLSSGQSITSIYSDITTPNYPYVYASSASSAWPMLVEKSSSDKYVQVGWYKANQQGAVADGVHYFAQVNYGFDPLLGNYDVHTTWNVYGPQANTIHGYRIRVENGLFKCYVDDVEIVSWPAKFTATGYHFYEELNGSKPYNAQFAGQANAHARFANLRIFANGTTAYSPTLTFTADANGKYDSAGYQVGRSNAFFDLWDARY